MGLFSKDIATMDDLLLHGLKDIYYAGNQIMKSLPKLIEVHQPRLNQGPQRSSRRNQVSD